MEWLDAAIAAARRKADLAFLRAIHHESRSAGQKRRRERERHLPITWRTVVAPRPRIWVSHVGTYTIGGYGNERHDDAR